MYVPVWRSIYKCAFRFLVSYVHWCTLFISQNSPGHLRHWCWGGAGCVTLREKCSHVCPPFLVTVTNEKIRIFKLNSNLTSTFIWINVLKQYLSDRLTTARCDLYSKKSRLRLLWSYSNLWGSVCMGYVSCLKVHQL